MIVCSWMARQTDRQPRDSGKAQVPPPSASLSGISRGFSHPFEGCAAKRNIGNCVRDRQGEVPLKLSRPGKPALKGATTMNLP